ncbi:MAG: alkaline phosphatase [Oscillospiraceae bacterium]|nr:alkaline phosphatase [Oscillospiraceae bacterium]
MKRKLFLTRCAAILAIIALLFSGCSKKPDTPSTAPSTSTSFTEATIPTVSVVPEETAVKNVIFMIADGGGYDNFTLANKVKEELTNRGLNKIKGARTEVTTGLLADIGLPTTKGLYLNSLLVGSANTLLKVPHGDANTYSSYITDSAAAGTALSSGYKTSYTYMGVTSDGVPRASITELARMNGMSTGVVTNKSYVDATPLAFFTAHAIHRKDNINVSMQALLSGIDVVIGEGTEYGDLYDISKSTHPRISASRCGYTIARSKTQLFFQSSNTGKLWAPILGVDNSTKELKDTQCDYTSDHIAYDVDTHISPEQPSLLDMTEAALQVFEHIDNPEGFFLMIEGGALDNAAEGGHLYSAVGEYLAFDEAFGYCVNWAAKRGDTIVIAVPDHDSGGFSGIEACEKALIDGIITGKIGDVELDSQSGFQDIADALNTAGSDTTAMALHRGHSDMAVPISLYAPDSIREELLTNMTLPTAAGNVRTGAKEYYVPNETGTLTWYASSALNADYVIDNTKISPALAKTLDLGSLDEASAILFNKIATTDQNEQNLIFDENPPSNGYGEYYAITYESADKSLTIDRNAASYQLNGQQIDIQKIGNLLPRAIFVTTDLTAQKAGSFYVPQSVYKAINGG